MTRLEKASVTGMYENRGETFPFPYRMEVSCYLMDTGLAQEFEITNTGNTPMPLTFGLHTVFACPGEIQVPIHKRWTVNDCHIPTGQLEELTEESRLYRDGMDPSGKLVRGFYTSAGEVARIGDFCYRVSSNFDQWVLWNGDGSSGFCAIEPLQGAVNALNSGEGLLRLQPGESIRFATAIYHREKP